MSNETETQVEKKKPDWRLIQEKAYYQLGPRGQSIRKAKTFEVAVGWDETSQKDNTPYIAFGNSVIPITPDVEGRVRLFLYPIKQEHDE